MNDEMSERRFMAQEMRDIANKEKFKCTFVTRTLNGGIILDCTSDVYAMLRQSADAEEEREANEKVKWSADKSMKDERDKLIAENAQLKARLDAVVKVAKEQFYYIFHSPMCWDEDENESHSLEQLKEMDALEKVVATARGEGGEE